MKPVKIQLDKTTALLHVTWPDGTVHNLLLEMLRQACPCASCKGGHHNMGGDLDPFSFTLPAMTTWGVHHIEPVGHHALRIFWADGHSDGMYAWTQLRKLGDSLTNGQSG